MRLGELDYESWVDREGIEMAFDGFDTLTN